MSLSFKRSNSKLNTQNSEPGAAHRPVFPDTKRTLRTTPTSSPGMAYHLLSSALQRCSIATPPPLRNGPSRYRKLPASTNKKTFTPPRGEGHRPPRYHPDSAAAQSRPPSSRALTGAPGTTYVGIENEELRMKKGRSARSLFSIFNFQFSISEVRHSGPRSARACLKKLSASGFFISVRGSAPTLPTLSPLRTLY